MSAKNGRYGIFGLIAVTVASIALTLCVLIGQSFDGMAHASDGLPNFVIATEDGFEWSLLLDGEVIETFEGKFSNPPQTNVASAAFERKMKSLLSELGTSKYTLEFKLPEIGRTVVGDTDFAYTQKSDGGFVLRGVYDSVISSDITEVLQYKTENSEYKIYGYAEERNGGLAFGINADAGNYLVRLAVFERFIFDGVLYSVARYSPAIGCTVHKAIPEVPSVQELSVVYGAKLSDIADESYLEEGTWSLSQTQPVEVPAGRDSVLDVREGGYTINFDYTPDNKNYETLKEIGIKVTVVPRNLRIYIGNAFSLIGEPLTDDFTYEVTSALVEGDTVEGLGIEIYVDGGDKDVAGQYMILARFANKNYTPDCRNFESAFLYGGIYTVYATRLSAVANDGAEFSVYIGGGYADIELFVETFAPDCEDEESDTSKSAGYQLIFRDVYNGERVFPNSEFIVAWQGGETVGATHIGVGIDGELSEVFEITDSFITVQATADMLIFYARNNQPNTAKPSNYFEAVIALASVCAVLAFAFITLTAIYFTRRRYFG